MLLKKLIIYVLILTGYSYFSQVKIGQWLDHLSYNYTNSVAKLGSKVYVSNGNALAFYDESDNRIKKVTKVEGLSDVGIKLLRKNENTNVLLVIYENTNIDIITDNNKIVNFSDIKRKIIMGDKVINEVYFKGDLAYISCGFGIIVFDTRKLEVRDTYYLGTSTVNYGVYQVTTNDTAIFAATPKGLFYGKINTNLSYFQNWYSLNASLPVGPFNAIVNFDGKIIANYSEKIKSNVSQKDTLYELTPSGWVVYSLNMYSSNAEIKKMFTMNNKLFIVDQYNFLAECNVIGQRSNYITNYGFADAFVNDGYYDGSVYWIADKNYGLMKSGGAFSYNEKLSLNGPDNNYVNDIDAVDGKLVVAPVYLGQTFDSQFQRQKPNKYENGEWKSLKHIIGDSIFDINAVAIDPNDKEHIAFAAMSLGFIEIKNDQVAGIYQYGNSPLVGINSGNDVRVTGVSIDKKSNIWASVTLGEKCIAVKKTDNTWVLLNFQQTVYQPYISKIIFDQHDQAWILLPRNGGLMVYNGVSGLPQPTTSNTKLLGTAEGKGFLPSMDVKSICEDKEGHIWLGSAKGISVFYNPQNVFTNSSFDSQQILIEQDGHVQILLENDIVTAIAVDGVNRKWVGTQGSGVYCFSADGQNEIYHFTEDSSPLYSNIIKDIVCDETTGDVFIASESGIQSYRTSIIKGFEEYTTVHAYPNPIKPGYTGNVVITGLIDDSTVKITDVFGNLVWSTTSQGGQVEWGLKTFSGTKAATGTYMIYCSSGDGAQYATAKLLIVN